MRQARSADSRAAGKPYQKQPRITHFWNTFNLLSNSSYYFVLRQINPSSVTPLSSVINESARPAGGNGNLTASMYSQTVPRFLGTEFS
jgi:hypothetical protein